jgi:hypothetical protein
MSSSAFDHSKLRVYFQINKKYVIISLDDFYAAMREKWLEIEI